MSSSVYRALTLYNHQTYYRRGTIQISGLDGIYLYTKHSRLRFQQIAFDFHWQHAVPSSPPLAGELAIPGAHLLHLTQASQTAGSRDGWPAKRLETMIDPVPARDRPLRLARGSCLVYQ